MGAMLKMAKFLIASDQLPKSEADAVTAAIDAAGLGYWHWVDNTWLIETDRFTTAMGLYDHVVSAVPPISTKVVVVPRWLLSEVHR